MVVHSPAAVHVHWVAQQHQGNANVLPPAIQHHLHHTPHKGYGHHWDKLHSARQPLKAILLLYRR